MIIKILIGTALAAAAALIHEFGNYAEEVNPWAGGVEHDKDN